MKRSTPIFRLKHKARLISRAQGQPLHAALDRVAREEGFASWSLLAAKHAAMGWPSTLFSRLEPKDLVLIGARPGRGKTLLSLMLALEAMTSGQRSVFFSLAWTERDVRDRFDTLGAEPALLARSFEFDGSDAIDADHIVDRLQSAPRGTLVVVDYLQALDQRRKNPELMQQVRRLRSFARAKDLILVFTSQISRSYDKSGKRCPDLGDVQLPNPLDLSLFDKTCFLGQNHVQLGTAH